VQRSFPPGQRFLQFILSRELAVFATANGWATLIGVRVAHSILLVLLLSGIAKSGADDRPRSETFTLSELQTRLDTFVHEPRFERAAWGIEIISLDSGVRIFSKDSRKLLKPASNAKLYTAALALDHLGPEFQVKTSIYATNRPNAAGELEGDLVIYGRGDPSVSVRFTNMTYQTLMDPLVRAITNAGVKHVKGELVGDETFFSGAPFGEQWTWDDLQYYYGAEVSSLTVQDNVVDLLVKPGAGEGEPCVISALPELTLLNFINRTRTGDEKGKVAIEIYRPIGETNVYVSGTLPLRGRVWSDAVTVPNPGRWYLALLREALGKAEVTIDGTTRTVHWPDSSGRSVSSLVEVGFIMSPPLSEILPKMLKPSQNLYAQLLLLQVGASVKDPPTGLSAQELGIRELKKFVGKAGISPGEVLLDEGSGLSRGCLATPAATVQLLKHMRTHAQAQIFFDSLPVAGEEGTLKTRLRELKGNLHAKTGSLRYVNSLSGYVRTMAGEPLAFSIMLNAYSPPRGAPNPRDELDQIVRWASQLKEKTSSTGE
jgi:D-alanyl-D-alanine carboxypeptidase/D-alanyl-D-alanine-endopeptidase (penicillin-binding protein 4)